MILFWPEVDFRFHLLLTIFFKFLLNLYGIDFMSCTHCMHTHIYFTCKTNIHVQSYALHSLMEFNSFILWSPWREWIFCYWRYSSSLWYLTFTWLLRQNLITMQTIELNYCLQILFNNNSIWYESYCWFSGFMF